MSSLPVASQIEVLDLRHFSARQLRPLLERETQVWRERLSWDYSSSTELLLQYIESRVLQGFVALDRGRICGYTFCVYEGQKAVIGDAFAAGNAFAAGRRSVSDIETTRTLLLHMLEVLRHTPMIDRVESQLLLYDAGEFADLFTGPEFTVYPRLFLECRLERQGAEEAVGDGFATQIALARWSPQDYQAAGELIYDCYSGHCDALINDQYQSLHGSLRFLHNIIRFPGCGVFEANLSWSLRDRQTGALIGIVLVSRIGAGVGHITQLCVAKACRGRGLGHVLLRQCADSLVRAGFHAITLTVTEANEQALKLYERFGFSVRHRFDAMVLDTRFRV
jgi:ribosomal protein S18 acetylase RimI-like enzyme